MMNDKIYYNYQGDDFSCFFLLAHPPCYVKPCFKLYIVTTNDD